MMRARRVGGVAALALLNAGCGLLNPDDRNVPDEVAARFEQVALHPWSACAVDLDRIARIGTAPDPDAAARSFELFVGTTDEGGEFQVVRQLDEDQVPLGDSAMAGRCDATMGDEVSWSGGQASGLNQFHAGRVPDGTETVVLHLARGDEVTVAAIEGDYYFAVISDAMSYEEIPQPELIEALDADGNVIAEFRP